MKKPKKKSTHSGMYYDIQEMDKYCAHLEQAVREAAKILGPVDDIECEEWLAKYGQKQEVEK